MTIAFIYAQELLQCLQTSLAGRPTPAPASICLRAGEEVTPMLSTTRDECCEGLAWVRIAGSQPRFGPDDNVGHCLNSLRRTTLEMGVARCMPTPGPDEIVSCAEWTQVALVSESDHSAMETALCCFADQQLTLLGVETITAGDYTPLGPQGRCVSGTLIVVVDHGCSCGTDGS